MLNLKTNRWAETAAHKFALQCEQEILCVIFFNFEVLVTGHSEDVMLKDLHSREEFIEVRGDDVFERYEARRPDGNESI